MVKKTFSIQVVLVIMVLMLQLVFPIGKAIVSADTGILPPSNLAFQSITPDDGKLTWSAVFGATSYKIYEMKDGQLTLLGSTTATNYSLNDLPEGSYRYVVSTLTSEGESAPSVPVSTEIVYPNMQAPATLNSIIRNGNDIVLSWGSSQYAQKYNIYQISESGERTLLTSTTAPNYTKANAAEGLYIYSVSAYHALYGESPDTAPVKVEVIHPEMKQPSNLSFTITNGTDVNLKWQASDYATSYKIYEDINGQLELKKTVTGTSATFSNLPAGDYTYKVYSYSDRFGQSTEGSQVSLTVGSITMAPPSNVTYKIQNINDVVLNWEAAPYATGYKVYELNNGERTLKSKVIGKAVTYSMLKAGDYEYEIHSYSDRFGESEAGSKVSFSIDTVKMYPPKDLSYKIQNGNDIALNWSASENTTNYKVYQIIDGQKVLKNTVTGTSVTLANMPAGNYQFEVHANSTRFGESEDGAQVSFTLEQISLSAPENAKYEVKNGNDIVLSWNSVEYATNYKVYQVIDGKKLLKSTVSSPAATFTNLPDGDALYEIYSYSNRFGESKEGTSVKISLVHPKMAAPANVIQTPVSPTSFTLSWNPVEYATSYKVYQIVDGQKVLKNNVTGTATVYSNMQPGVYKYEVYSYSTRFGESREGTPIEVTLSGQALATPGNLTYSISNGNDVILKWDAVQYATNYKIYQIIAGVEVLQGTVTGTKITLANMPEGEFNFVVKAYSLLLGESPNGAEIKGSIDFPVMAKPQNLMQSISNGNDITLNWNLVPYATAYKIYQIIDGEKVLKKTVMGTSTTFTNMLEGNYQYVVHSYSDRFGESLEGSTLEFSLTWPIMQAPGNLTKTITNGNDIVLKWNSSAYAKEYRVYQIVDGQKVLKGTVTGTSVTFTNMPEGDYEYAVHSYSGRFGESPKGSTLEFNLTWPIIQASTISGSVFNANNVNLTWKAVTWANGYEVYKVNGNDRELIYKGPALSYKVYNLTEGTHSFEVTAYSNRFGKSVPSERFNQQIVYPIMESPTVSLKLLSEASARISWDFVTYANSYNVYEIIEGKPVLLVKNLNSTSYDIQSLSYTNHEYYVTAYSNSFGESKPSATVIAKLITDTQAPETKSNAPTQWVNQNQLITLQATDNEVGVANTFYSLNDGPFQEGTSILVDQEGINKISFNSIDKAGNKEEVKTEFVKIDKTAPNTSSNAPEAWVKEDVTVTLTAEDANSGAAKTYYSINGSEYAEGTSFMVEKEGINTISYYSIDAAGNKEEVKSKEIKIDKTAPTTSSDAPEAWVNKDVAVALTAEDANSGAAKTYYSINGSEYTEGTSFVVEKEGIHTISYYSIDAAGNKEEGKSKEVKIDKTAPTTSSDAPEAWVNEEVTITLKAEDGNSGVAKTYYSINGLEYAEGNSFVIEKEGIHTISYYSIDAAGNKEEVKSKEIKIDKTAPTVSVDWEEEYKLGTSFTLDYDANDNLSGVAIEEVTLNGEAYKKGDKITLGQPGEYKLSIKVTDAAGLSTVVEKTFIVYIPVNLEVLPKVIKGNKGIFTVKAILPAEYQSFRFDVSSVTLNGVSAVADNKGLQTQAEKGNFKFNREEFVWTTGEVNLEFRGYVNNKFLVVGKNTVEVKK